MCVLPTSLSLFLEYPATRDIYTLSLHDALPISDLLHGDRPAELAGDRREGRVLEAAGVDPVGERGGIEGDVEGIAVRSEEHTSELQSHSDLVCRLAVEKKTSKRWATTTGRGVPR